MLRSIPCCYVFVLFFLFTDCRWFADYQGKEALKSQFEQTLFVCGNDEYLPMYFEPYRGDEPGKSVAQFTVGRCINPVAPISMGC